MLGIVRDAGRAITDSSQPYYRLALKVYPSPLIDTPYTRRGSGKRLKPCQLSCCFILLGVIPERGRPFRPFSQTLSLSLAGRSERLTILRGLPPIGPPPTGFAG
jgi:hypothetical protein